ncbi:MAG: nucleoside hydrolase [Geodermatophilaceae bacterium]
MRIHLDTDLGGDPDDACALAMLLGWPDVEITGITTTIDPGGWRAAYVLHCLELLDRTDIPVAAGAAMSMTRRAEAMPVIGDERYWPDGIRPRPSPPGAAVDLLQRSIDGGPGWSPSGRTRTSRCSGWCAPAPSPASRSW